MKKMSKKKKYAAAMAALSLLLGGTATEARDHQVINYNGYDVFDVIYFDAADQGDWVQNYFWSKKSDEHQIFSYHFSSEMKSWMNEAFLQWAEILKPGLANIKSPAQLIVGCDNQVVLYNNNLAKYWDKHYVKDALTTDAELPYVDLGVKSADEYDANYEKRGYHGFSKISVGQGYGANVGNAIYGWTGGISSQNNHPIMGTYNLTRGMFHEIGHALGISAAVYDKTLENDLLGLTQGSVFGALADDSLDYTSHLFDENGNQARAGQVVVSPDAKNENDEYIYTPAQQEAMKAIIKAHPEKYFMLSTETDVNSAKGKAFFKGKNVSEVLDGRTFWGVDGLPINGMEGGIPELSHIELERSMMSHQLYNSYNTFMEAELALLQDIGYKIDRKNFYGRSIYNNDRTVENNQGFFARNEAGTDYLYGQPNTSTLGVGLHVYGSRNEITQTSNGANDGSADLLACGLAGTGIRIDGVENKVTLAKDASIVANGKNGAGILVAYGRDHQVNVEGNISALGDGGDAVRFDFGNGSGETYEYRGSYMRYQIKTDSLYKDYITSLEDLQIKDSSNFALLRANGSFSDTVNGDLNSKMGSLTVSGTLAGKSHAVYIAKNAFVDNINIEKGAQIYGDIASDWKHFEEEIYGDSGKAGKEDSKLFLQYRVGGTGLYPYYDEYCSDLVTNLNINGDFAYAGNITGSDNMKLKVNKGANMAYTGNADVVSVQVAEGASLYGGNYKVNKIAKYAEGEPADKEAGKLINHGTIGALTGDSHMNIDGNLENDGTMEAYAGGKQGAILVSGEAVLNSGSKAAAVRGIHGETVHVLSAEKGISGRDNVTGESRGLLNYAVSYTDDGKSLNVEAHAKESLAGANFQQAQDYESIKKNSREQAKNPGAEKELRSFYALEGDAKALEAIDEIGTNDKKDSTTAILSAQTSGLVSRVLSSRLAKTMGQAPAMLRVGTDHQQPPELDHSVWAKFSRNWGDTASGSNYTGNTYTIGCDWQQGDNRRNGWFGSYTKSRYGHGDGSEKLQDTRVGYYTGMNKGANTMLLYADFGYLDGSRSRMVHMNSLNTSNIVKGDYTGWLVELGGEWKHALHEPGTTTWQVSPYGAVQMSYLKQHGYSETGSLKAYDVSGGNNFYSALEGGVEFSRDMPKGGLNFRLGLRQALTGTDYDVWETSSFLGRSWSKSSKVDKTHFVTSLAVETELASNWQLGAEAAFRKGAHDRDFMANLQLRWLW